MYTLCGLKSSSDRLSLYMGNFDYLDDKNLFLVPSFCAAKVGVILEWCFVSEASRHSTLRSCASRSGRYRGHKRLIVLEQTAIYPQSAVCSLNFTLIDIKRKKLTI